jgi:hypothetical protein
MSDYLTNQALVASFEGLGLGLEIAYENRDFNPPDSNPWVSLFRLPNDRESLTKAELDEERGIFQISFYTPSDEGIGNALETIDTILQYYKHNRTISAGGHDVVIVNSGRAIGQNKNGWWRSIISVEYKTDIQRV